MIRRRGDEPVNKFASIVACIVMLAALALENFAQTPGTETVRPMLWQAGMPRSDVGEVNVFRRFPRDLRAKVTEFYEQVLAIKPLPSTAAGGNAMIRYPIGASEVKLFPVAMANENRARPVRDVIGIRLLTFFFPDEAALTARFKKYGYPAPEFRSRGGGAGKAALVQDADGQWVELVVLPGAPPATYDRFEIGLTVADVEQSRAFYRDFIGMEEAKPVRDELLGTMKYTYRYGTTTINVWSFAKDLPKDTNTAGLQYIVWNVEGVDKVAKARSAKIDRPLSAPGSPRTVWLFDPDGITNYFAQFAGN
jgi:catechol 2,3-dioxygenase-like lactoylglutathione lyase family enzyme